MFFKGDYLRVTSPVTQDGNIPLVIDDRAIKKETFLPLSAKKALEEENAHLPNHLKKKIEVVSNTHKPQQGVPVPEKQVVVQPVTEVVTPPLETDINVNDL